MSMQIDAFVVCAKPCSLNNEPDGNWHPIALCTNLYTALLVEKDWKRCGCGEALDTVVTEIEVSR